MFVAPADPFVSRLQRSRMFVAPADPFVSRLQRSRMFVAKPSTTS